MTGGVNRSMRYEPSRTFETDLAECRALLSTGSRTFYAASFLLPRRIREPASALYAFCRLADDVIDLGPSSGAGLSELQHRLECAYAGRPLDIAADRAFAETVARFDIPRAIPEALLEGFAWDADGRRYENLPDLLAYATRVAGTVGAMMALLMDRRAEIDLARATDLGIAMQLTNIARDVGEDARAGRLYLPRAWIRESGLDPDAWLKNPIFSAEIASVIARLLATADALYVRSGAGIARLPADCRPGIYAARYLYAEIGHELRRQGCNSIAHRAVVPTGRKLQLLGRAVAATPLWGADVKSGAVAEAAFLVHAAAHQSKSGPRSAAPMLDAPWWDVRGKALVLLEILERIERREMRAREERGRARSSTSLSFPLEAQP